MASLTLSRFGYGALNVPSVAVNPLRNQVRLASKLLTPRGGRLGHASMRQHDIRPSVGVLDRPSRPHAILFGIWAVVVLAFQRHARMRARPHVGVEAFKTGPFRTNHNAALSIVGVALDVWIAATRFHVAPNAVFRAIRSAMRAPKRAREFSTQASAAVRRTLLKIADVDRLLSSALAFTQQMARSSYSGGFTNDCPSPKASPTKAVERNRLHALIMTPKRHGVKQ